MTDRRIVKKQFYVYGEEADALLRIAKARNKTQQQLFSQMVERLIAESA